MNKVRLFAAFLLLAVFVSSFSSCGKTRRDGLSDDIYNLGVAAVEIADEYLNGKISIESAFERIGKNSDHQYDVKNTMENDSSVRIFTTSLEFAMRDKLSGVGTNEDIQKKRDLLAGELWK